MAKFGEISSDLDLSIAADSSLSGINTGDQVADGVTITGAGTIADPFVSVSGGGGDISGLVPYEGATQDLVLPGEVSLKVTTIIANDDNPLIISGATNTVENSDGSPIQILGSDASGEGYVGGDIEITPGAAYNNIGESGRLRLSAFQGSKFSTIKLNELTDDRVHTLPDKDGTFAMLDDIGGGSGDVTGPLGATGDTIVLFDGDTGKIIKDSAVTIDSIVPYEGAISSVNLGANALTTDNLRGYQNTLVIQASDSLSGTVGNSIQINSSAGYDDGSTAADGGNIDVIPGAGVNSGNSGKFRISNSIGRYVALESSDSNTEDINITLPNSDGTLALISDLSGKLDLSGGTLTGNLNIGTESDGHNLIIDSTLGVEAFTDFTVAGNWTLPTGWESTNDGGTQLNHNASGTSGAVFLANTPTAGLTYKIEVTANASVTGGFGIYYGGHTLVSNVNPTVGVPTTYTYYCRITATSNLSISPITTARFVITSISIKPITIDTGDISTTGDILMAGRLRNPTGSIGLNFDPTGQARFGGPVAMNGALVGVSTGAFSGAVTTTQSSIATTPTDGFSLVGGVASAGTPARISPSIKWLAGAWNTTPTAASKINTIEAYLHPSAGATTSATLVFANRTVDGNPNATTLMGLTTGGLLTIGATTPTHTLTLPSSATGIALYNTADQTTNYERLRIYNTGNVHTIASENGGSGTLRELKLTNAAGFTLRLNSGSSAGIVQVTGSTGFASGIGVNISPTFAASSGTVIGAQVTPTITTSGTNGYTALLINPTETSTGSGAKNLIDAQVGSVSKFTVANDGATTITGGFNMNTSGSALTLTYNPATNFSNGVVIRKKGTTGDATAATANGSEIGYHTFSGFDGSAYKRLAYVILKAKGNTTPTTGGGSYQIVTRGDAGNAEATRLTIDESGLTIPEAHNLLLGTTTGTKIGTATNQKLSLWNATPIVQPTTSVAAATFVAGSGTEINETSTFDGYTIKQVVKALRNIGILG